MSKTAILRFLSGSLQSGYPVVELRIIDQQTGHESSVRAELPSSQQLYELVNEFSQVQGNWNRSNDRWRNRPTNHPRGLDLPDDPLTNQANDIVDKIQKALDYWLEERAFAKIKDKFLSNAQTIQQIFIETSDLSLQKMPWKRWQIIESECPNAKIALFDNEKYFPQERLRNPVKILAILGRDTNIDLEVDRGFLEKMPAATTTIIPKNPDQELTLDEFHDALRNETYDILFFAGHSLTNTEGTDTQLWINSTESVTIESISWCLREAVERGLKIAIFNSCSGLGIPRKLSSLNISIPYLIVMIEPIHDKLAQKFLEIFLINHFVTGKSLQQSFQTALSNLRVWQHQSPNADFLPVLFHNPRNPPIFYPKLNFLDHIQLFLKAKDKKSQFFRILKNFSWLRYLLLSILVAMFIRYVIPILIPQTVPNPQLMSDFCPKNSLLLTCGDSNLINYPIGSPALSEERDGQYAFSKSYYKEAHNFFQQAWKKEKDPTTLIAKNNTKVFAELQGIKINKDNIYTIAVVIPYDIDSDVVGKNMLANVARKQSEFNESNSPRRLIVLMANDSNDTRNGEKIASELGTQKNVLAVVGPYSSHMAAYVIDDYRKNNLSLISPSVTTSLQYLRDSGVSDTSFFFRTVSSTKIAAEDMINYLEKHGYQQIILFYQDRELFSKSFFLDFQDEIKKSPLKIVYKKQFIDWIPANIKADLAILKQQYEKDKTAIVLLADAYTDERGQSNKLEIIKSNDRNFFIIGSNTIEDQDVLNLGQKALEKVIVTVPYFPTKEQNEDFQKVFGQNENLSWHGVMTYDTTEVLIKAITQLIDLGEKPTRETIQKVLSGQKGQFKVEGLTGNITLKGSDRQEDSNVLIQLNCLSNSCQGWKEVPE